MDRARLLKALRSAGFTGKSLDEAVTFYKDEGLAFKVKGSDTILDEAAIRKAWDTAATVEVEAENPAAKVKAVEIDEDEDEDSAADKLRKKRAADMASVNIHVNDGANMSSERKFGRKNYERKIKSGQKTVFSSEDSAEVFGAYCRVAYAQSTGKTYDFEAEDRQILKDAGILTKTTSTLTNTNAGYLVNPLFSNEVWYNTEPHGLAVQIANVQNCSGTDDWSVKRKTGIMTMSHVGEGQTISTGNNTYDRVHLIPKTAGVLNDITNQMLDDAAVNVADDWANSIREARDNRIDDDYFNGDGTATYGGHVGLKNALPSGAYINASGAAWSNITSTDINKLPGFVQNVNLARCGYVCSRQYYTQVMVPMQRALGGVTSAEGVMGGMAKPVQGVVGSPNAYFNGWPVWFSQRLGTASGSGQKDLFFGDFVGGSVVGLSKDLQLDISKEFGFDKYKTYLRAVTRFAVNICGDGRGTTYGNIVCLQTT